MYRRYIFALIFIVSAGPSAVCPVFTEFANFSGAFTVDIEYAGESLISLTKMTIHTYKYITLISNFSVSVSQMNTSFATVSTFCQSGHVAAEAGFFSDLQMDVSRDLRLLPQHNRMN